MYICIYISCAYTRIVIVAYAQVLSEHHIRDDETIYIYILHIIYIYICIYICVCVYIYI